MDRKPKSVWNRSGLRVMGLVDQGEFPDIRRGPSPSKAAVVCAADQLRSMELCSSPLTRSRVSERATPWTVIHLILSDSSIGRVDQRSNICSTIR